MRAVDVRHERVEPDDVGGEPRVEGRIGRRRERQRPGQEVHAEVRAGAVEDQLLDLGVRLGVAELGGHVDDDELGNRQAERASQLARDDLRHERAAPLPGAAELRDVHPVVVGLEQAGQRPALTQWRDVAGGGDVTQRLEHARKLRSRARARAI